MRQKIIDLISKVAKEPDGFETLEKEVSKFSRLDLSNNIIDCGILPEMFTHDSSEEKMWAKYSDVVFATFFTHMGFDSEVLGTRGNSADVLARSERYTVVGDAKTFRLSRTAKNQKDFKVSALDSWRQSNNYSVLAGPLFQFPSRNSQIYTQAIQRNVTLVSYVHLKYLLDQNKKINLEPLWTIGDKLKNRTSTKGDRANSVVYWKSVDKITCQITETNVLTLAYYKKKEIEQLQEIGREGINYWEEKVKEYEKLPREEAIRQLIKAHKIDKKIKQIRRAIDININSE